MAVAVGAFSPPAPPLPIKVYLLGGSEFCSKAYDDGFEETRADTSPVANCCYDLDGFCVDSCAWLAAAYGFKNVY